MARNLCGKVWSSAAICFCFAVFWERPAQGQPWMDPSLTPDARASLLLGNMSQDEKIAMVHGVPGPYVGNSSGVSRLGIPGLHLEDGPAGVADGVQGVT